MKIFVGIFLSLAASLSVADNWIQEGNEAHHNLAVKACRQAERFAPAGEAARESQHYINSACSRPVRYQEHG